MKSNFLLYLTLFYSIYCSNIASDLWTREFMGTPTNYNFIKENEAIVSTDKGVITRYNTQRGEIQWKKNMVYSDSYILDSIEKCIKILIFRYFINS